MRVRWWMRVRIVGRDAATGRLLRRHVRWRMWVRWWMRVRWWMWVRIVGRDAAARRSVRRHVRWRMGVRRRMGVSWWMRVRWWMGVRWRVRMRWWMGVRWWMRVRVVGRDAAVWRWVRRHVSLFQLLLAPLDAIHRWVEEEAPKQSLAVVIHLLGADCNQAANLAMSDQDQYIQTWRDTFLPQDVVEVVHVALPQGVGHAQSVVLPSDVTRSVEWCTWEEVEGLYGTACAPCA